jgi:hypothetical protein
VTCGSVNEAAGGTTIPKVSDWSVVPLGIFYPLLASPAVIAKGQRDPLVLMKETLANSP